MEPACAQACPTESIQFGPLEELRERAQQRVERLHEQGVAEAELYGESPDDGVGGFGAFFLLLDKPEVYGLPPDPIVPTRRLPEIWGAALLAGGRARRQRPGGRRRREPMSAEPGSHGPDGSGYRSYYGKPIIKEPVWEPVIPAYFFFGGTAGAAASLGLAARLSANPALARTATYVNAVAIGVSPALLIIDLGRPERFLNMLRMFKVTSPMSVGTWIVTFSGLASGLATSLEILGRLPRAKLAAEAAAGALGPFLSTYTAALLADTAVPAWHEARRELPFVFAGSSAASAGAACAMIAPARSARPARRLAIAGAALELTAASVMERRLGFLAEPYKRGRAGALATAAKALTAAGALTMLLQGRQRTRRGRGRRSPAGGLVGRALRDLPRGPRLRERPSIHRRPPATARRPARRDARVMPLAARPRSPARCARSPPRAPVLGGRAHRKLARGRRRYLPVRGSRVDPRTGRVVEGPAVFVQSRLEAGVRDGTRSRSAVPPPRVRSYLSWRIFRRHPIRAENRGDTLGLTPVAPASLPTSETSVADRRAHADRESVPAVDRDDLPSSVRPAPRSEKWGTHPAS